MTQAIFAILFFFLSACSSTPAPIDTPSGRPEIQIDGKPPKDVMQAMVARNLREGNRLIRVSEFELVFARLMDNSLLASLLYGSRYDSTPEMRVIYVMVATQSTGQSGTRVFARAEVATNPNSRHEQISDVTRKLLKELQANLARYKRQLEAGN